jgi:hypothetical protein
MTNSKQNNFANNAATPAEETLRLIARLSPPAGLEDRVQTTLRAAAKTGAASSPKAQIFRWPAVLQLNNLWMQSSWARAAAAAAIVAVVVGGGWGISSRFQPAQPDRAITIPPRANAQGGFSSAGAMRTPQTLDGPVVAHPAAVPQQSKPAIKPPTQKPHHRVKPASTSKEIVQPATPPIN